MTDLYEDQDQADMAALARREDVGQTVTSFAAGLAAIQSGEMELQTTADLDTEDDGHVYLDDKSRLVKRPFAIVKVKRINSDSYGPGVRVNLITENENRIKFTDFSSGIAAQCQALLGEADVFEGFVLCRHGLVKSDYKTPDGISATTYYLDTQGGALPAGEL